MGNLCGKPSSKDNFEGPGRVLGAAPAPANARASVPPRIASASAAAAPKPQPKVGGPARTLGNSDAGNTSNDPRSAAAAAAEARSKKSPIGTGDLAKKLEAQKKQTHNQALQSAAAENVAQRQADANTAVRNYN